MLGDVCVYIACGSVVSVTMTDLENAHRSLTTVATAQSCSKSELTANHVSVHTLPQTASFSNIDALATAAKAESYVGTIEQDLVFSSRLGAKKAARPDTDTEEATEEAAEPPPKKRRRFADNGFDENVQRVATARERLAKQAPTLPSEELDVAQKVLTKLVKDLRGPGGEIVVQSSAILSKKLGVSDSRPRVVVAARLNAGVEISVSLLKSCMAECWNDGVLTTLSTLHGIGHVELPLSEEAQASAFFGNATILLVTSVPTK